MNTLEKLQAHLMHPAIEYKPGIYFKPITKRIDCADGSSLSVQASETHYSTPRNNYGPYQAVEVWCIENSNDTEVLEFEYDPLNPSGYVSIEAVAAYIDRHGGFAP